VTTRNERSAAEWSAAKRSAARCASIGAGSSSEPVGRVPPTHITKVSGLSNQGRAGPGHGEVRTRDAGLTVLRRGLKPDRVETRRRSMRSTKACPSKRGRTQRALNSTHFSANGEIADRHGLTKSAMSGHAPRGQIAVAQTVSRTSTVNEASSSGKRTFSYLRDQAPDYLIPAS
jgi:hypothetical protein